MTKRKKKKPTLKILDYNSYEEQWGLILVLNGNIFIRLKIVNNFYFDIIIFHSRQNFLQDVTSRFQDTFTLRDRMQC